MVHTKALRVALYCRVSTQDQSCERQERELQDFAERAGYKVVAVFKETASGTKNDREERLKVMALAQKRLIDAVVVTEASRWGRSLPDLLSTLQDLTERQVSLVATNGFEFNLQTAQGKLLAGILGSLAEFERDLIRERVLSGLANARAKGKKLGRQQGQCPSDKVSGKVMKYIAEGRSYRWIAHDLGISKTTVMAINKRHQKQSA